MRSRLALILLATAAFAAVLAWRLPLRWALPLLPAGISCGEATGSVWAGRCGALAVPSAQGPLALGAVRWQLRPSRLLRLQLAGALQAEGPTVQGSTRFAVGAGGALLLEDLSATLPLERRLLPVVPANWTGRLQLEFTRLQLEGRRLLAAEGELQAHDIVATGPRPDSFGSYALRMPGGAADGPQLGQLRDLGGPLELSGTVAVQPDLSWQVDALLRTRPSAGSGLQKLVEYLGPPDAQGRRSFSAAGEVS